MCLDLKNMHFSFPFTAGEYPEARYGHASCNYCLSPNDPESLMLLGGINHGFCTMDIYTLVEIKKQTNQQWVKVIEKTEYENQVFNRASKYVYEARKHCLDLHDIIVKERSKGIEIRKEDETIKENYKKVKEDCQDKVDAMDEEIKKVDLENEGLREQMKYFIEVYNFEEYICELLEDRSVTLEDYFKKMQDYMNVSDRVFTMIKTSKFRFNSAERKKTNTKKNKEMKSAMDTYKQSIHRNRKKYQEGLLFLKHFYELAIKVI